MARAHLVNQFVDVADADFDRFRQLAEQAALLARQEIVDRVALLGTKKNTRSGHDSSMRLWAGQRQIRREGSSGNSDGQTESDSRSTFERHSLFSATGSNRFINRQENKRQQALKSEPPSPLVLPRFCSASSCGMARGPAALSTYSR
jgi:hypothetical protein